MVQSSGSGSSGGTCYGFDVLSSLEFEYLRDGAGTPLVVEEAKADARQGGGELVKMWPAIPGKRALTSVYRDNGSFTVEIGDAHWFHVDPRSPRITMSRTAQPKRREMMLWTTPAALGVVARGDLAIHAAAVDVDGRAVLLAAPSGHGKTTTAAAFMNAGYRVLADDFSCCRVQARPAVLPGPALLRVGRDVVSQLDLPGACQSHDPKGKLHLTIPKDMRGNGAPVELAAIVFLRSGTEGVTLEPTASASVLPDLWALSFHLPGENRRTRCFQDLAEMISRVPAWNLSRELDFTCLPRVVEEIAGLVGAR